MAKRAGALVVGGSIVLLRDGKHYCREPFARYLSGLVRQLGAVHFFGVRSATIQDASFASQLPSGIKYTALQFPDAAGSIVKMKRYLADLVALGRAARASLGTIEFVPASGGWAGSAVLAACSSRYLVYYGADPKLRWCPSKREGGRGSAAKALHFRISGGLSARLADYVLVRDSTQLERLPRNRAEVSRPLIAAVRTISSREAPRDEVRYLFVGKLQRSKGIEELLVAFQRVRNRLLTRGVEAKLVLAGAPTLSDGFTVEEVKQRASQMGCEAAIVPLGYIDDPEELSRWYDWAHALVLPSHAEGFPRVVDEAIAVGLPIIATRLPSIAARLRAGVDALLVEPRSIDELASAMERIAAEPGVWDGLRRSCQAMAEAAGSVDAAQQHAALLLKP